MTTIIYEKSRRSDACCDFLHKSGALRGFDKFFLLPIPTSRGGMLKGSDISVSEALSSAGEGSLVVGYGIPDDAKEEVLLRGGVVVDVSADESFLVENAHLTALGALGILLSGCASVPSDLTFGIVGYGRIGKSLVRMLLYHGARVIVFSSKESVRLELGSYGIETRRSDSASDASGIDILINTAPTVLFDGGDLLSVCPRVIDLASGNAFPDYPDVEKYPSLPAKAFPLSAGRCLAGAVIRSLGEGGAL